MTAPALARGATLEVRSTTLGTLHADPADLVTFPSGLAGLPQAREWVLVRTEREGFYWLQSRQEAALTFLLADPFRAFPGYEVELGPGDLAALGSRGAQDVAVLAVVTLPGRPGAPLLANLQGPLALDLRTRRGRQVILSESPYGIRCEMAA